MAGRIGPRTVPSVRRSGPASSADRTAASDDGDASRDPQSALENLKCRLAALGKRNARRGASADDRSAPDPAGVERDDSLDGGAIPGDSPESVVTASSPDAYRQALGLLVRREHSRAELQRKLRARGADPDAASNALETLREQGYQDDARFAEMLIRTRINGGYGPLHIRAELGMHRIDPEIAQHALLEAAPDWGELATLALKRRYGARVAADRAESLKRGQFLQRRGFDVASIRFALDSAACS
jgi:regulatory protein